MNLRWGVLLLAGAAFAAQNPPAPTFSTGTKLVQVSVVAQDKQGKPVADLRREEFQVFDNGLAQEIRLFVAEKALPSSPEPKAPGTFTNRIAAPAGSHSGYSVILIDDLFSGSDPTNEEGSSLSRVQALKMLRSIPVGEKIAIYALRGKLQVICEFSSDRDLLVRQLRKWEPTPSTPAPEQRPSLLAQLAPQIRGDAAADFARVDMLQRAEAGNIAFGAIADHLAGIPGRKNLILLANKFLIGPPAMQKLVRAGVSIYPVDIDGVCRLCPERPKDTMDAIAAVTGGVAYYSRNDLDIAMREAMDDGRVSYTLGFYQPIFNRSTINQSTEDKPPAMHRLSLRVGRPGVVLRYTTSYTVEPSPPVSASPVADLLQSLNRPVDATAIPIKAAVTRMGDRLNLEATLDAESLDLVLSESALEQNLWAGSIEVVARFSTADAIIAGDVFSKTMTLNLSQASYDAAVHSGLPFQNEFTIPPKAVELKLMFANLATGKIGTLTVPLALIEGSAAGAK